MTSLWVSTLLCFLLCNPNFARSAVHEHTDRTKRQTGRICQAKADIVYLLDASGSVGTENYDKQLHFTARVSQQFDINPSNAQIGAIVFGTSVAKIFDLKDNPDEATVTKAILNIPYLREQATFTHKALNLVIDGNMFSPESGGREDAENIVILITDGEASLRDSTITAANRLRETGAHVISVGIGPRIALPELKLIASSDNDVFTVDSFDDLTKIEHVISSHICAELCDRTVDFAIVGGGPSGTYSAYRLRDEGLNIEFFEYSDRIGGRLYTSKLPNIADLNLELGGMRYIDKVHPRLQKLIAELGLTPKVFVEGFGKPGRLRFYLRGQSMSTDQVKTGSVPYNLSPEEKAHQSDIYQFYLEKLTGFSDSFLPRDRLLKLKLTSDGTELYKLSLDEALDRVATLEGKQFAGDINVFEGENDYKTSSVNVFNEHMGEYSLPGEVFTLAEGMSSFPQTLLKKFLEASNKHKLSMNKKLLSIQSASFGRNILKFIGTETKDGFTTEKGGIEHVCAKRVILGIPQNALQELDWSHLKTGRVQIALDSVTPYTASKVFMTFEKQWWLSADARNPSFVTKSDTGFSQMYDWTHSNISGDFVMIASYADLANANILENMNNQGPLMKGSATGFNKVSENLKTHILDLLANAFGINRALIPEPISAVSQWWTKYPFGGGWTLWRPGVNFFDAKSTIRRPSLTDDIFIVGADHAFGSTTAWIEGALETVDEVFDAYF